ncbi:hypothetical protein [Arthrobacter sp. zg-Y1110]|uniref:hypothetical protein n=1 Tax=Arthrobacter sp. zg-Y1110 TaxID=2886932 RepID=UPI001D1472F0|nr:hypothetical protein [Arthrobacter sp. zg-Y1110]MCC3292926.1 hypothetical protein [Arthrobacter sp. zg-Y1110]UWX86865.1 hypothetical protein N2K99_18655 [Arthrobacter sp. zg-Y1110]
MEKILSQHRWNQLPVNSYARLTYCGPEGDRHSYVTRVRAETGPAAGENLSLGGAAWRDAFNDADVAYALYVPGNDEAFEVKTRA